eukprot:COSAG02_NODE_43763_length_372_cov_0.549451_1_plen_80_part_10
MFYAVVQPANRHMRGLLALVLLSSTTRHFCCRAIPRPPRPHVHSPECAHQRGVVIYPDDLYGEGMVDQWVDWLKTADLNY